MLQKPFITIECDSNGFIYVNWKGYVSIDDVKEGCEGILRCMQEKGVSLLLIDNRELFGTWTQSIRWLAEEFMPRIVETGLEKIAFIYSFEKSARYSVDRFLEVNDQYDGQTFEDYNKAEAWLLGKFSHSSEPNNTSRHSLIPIREGLDTMFVDINQILYVSCENGQVSLHTLDETYTMNSSMKEFLNKICPDRIVQVHRSYAVNVSEIISMKYYSGGSYKAYLKALPKVSIPVGRKYAPFLKEALGIF